MKMSQARRVLTLGVVMGVLSALTVGTALGAEPKHVTKVHQAAGKKAKASALAPRPTRQRVFGAPIQGKIMHSAPPKKPPQ